MSDADYLLNLHKEGRIDDSALNKALNELQSTTKTVGSVQPSALEKQQRQKYKQLQKAVIDELKQVLSQRKSVSELNLVDKPKCGYFKAYEISADKYKDPNKLFRDKKSVITQQIVKELKELGGLKFQLTLTINFYKDDGADKTIVIGVLHGDQMAILTPDKIDEFYNNSSAQIQTGIEKFTNTASGLEIDHCTRIYLNIAKYEPLKGSSKISLPKALVDKKAIINFAKQRRQMF